MIISSLDVGRFLSLAETTNAAAFGEYAPHTLVLYVDAKRRDEVQWDVSFRAIKLEAADRLGGVWHALGLDEIPPADWSEISPKDVQVGSLPPGAGGQVNAEDTTL